MKPASISIVALIVVGSAVCIGALAQRQRDQKNIARTQSTHLEQLWHCGMHPQVIQDHPGDCPICHMALTPIGSTTTTGTSTERKILYWWDPMLGASSI